MRSQGAVLSSTGWITSCAWLLVMTEGRDCSIGLLHDTTTAQAPVHVHSLQCCSYSADLYEALNDAWPESTSLHIFL